MDVPTFPSTPLGPMTRARAKAIKDKVNSLLSELPIPTTRHGYYLIQKLCVLSGAWKRAMEQLPPRAKTARTPIMMNKKKSCREATGVGRPTVSGRPTSPRTRTTGPLRTSDTSSPKPNLRTSGADRTTGRQAPKPNPQTTDSLRTYGPS